MGWKLVTLPLVRPALSRSLYRCRASHLQAYTEPMPRFPRDASVVATERQLSTTLGDEVIILGLDDTIYYGLSDTGVRIWELIQARRTVGEILDVLVAEYEVDRHRAETDLEAVLVDLHSRGLIAISQPPLDR